MNTEDCLHIVEDEIERARARIVARVSEACQMSEDGVLAAGSSLATILRETKAQTEELATLSTRLDGDGSGDGAGALVTQASTMMREFVKCLSSELNEQDAFVTAAMATMQRILEVGSRIGGIASASRFLALNAVIEANRLGVAGNASRVIAQEMKELSRAVGQANTLVESLVTELTSSLPQVAAGAHGMIAQVEAFRTAFDRRLSGVDGAFAELADAARHAVALSDARLQCIIDTSHQALGKLQFQDPMVKALQEIEAFIVDARSKILVALGLETAPLKTSNGDDRGSAPIAAGELSLF